MSHTPAPWKIGGKYKSDIYGRNGLTAVARCFISTTDIGGHEQKANISLIAAAPELLEALKAFDALIKHQYSGTREAMSDLTLTALWAKAAIAKAEGKV